MHDGQCLAVPPPLTSRLTNHMRSYRPHLRTHAHTHTPHTRTLTHTRTHSYTFSRTRQAPTRAHKSPARVGRGVEACQWAPVGPPSGPRWAPLRRTSTPPHDVRLRNALYALPRGREALMPAARGSGRDVLRISFPVRFRPRAGFTASRRLSRRRLGVGVPCRASAVHGRRTTRARLAQVWEGCRWERLCDGVYRIRKGSMIARAVSEL